MGSIDAPEWLKKKMKDGISSKKESGNPNSIPAPDFLKKNEGQVGGDFGIGSKNGSEIPTIELEKSELEAPSTSVNELPMFMQQSGVTENVTKLRTNIQQGNRIDPTLVEFVRKFAPQEYNKIAKEVLPVKTDKYVASDAAFNNLVGTLNDRHTANKFLSDYKKETGQDYTPEGIADLTATQRIKLGIGQPEDKEQAITELIQEDLETNFPIQQPSIFNQAGSYDEQVRAYNEIMTNPEKKAEYLLRRQNQEIEKENNVKKPRITDQLNPENRINYLKEHEAMVGEINSIRQKVDNFQRIAANVITPIEMDRLVKENGIADVNSQEAVDYLGTKEGREKLGFRVALKSNARVGAQLSDIESSLQASSNFVQGLSGQGANPVGLIPNYVPIKTDEDSRFANLSETGDEKIQAQLRMQGYNEMVSSYQQSGNIEAAKQLLNKQSEVAVENGKAVSDELFARLSAARFRDNGNNTTVGTFDITPDNMRKWATQANFTSVEMDILEQVMIPDEKSRSITSNLQTSGFVDNLLEALGNTAVNVKNIFRTDASRTREILNENAGRKEDVGQYTPFLQELKIISEKEKEGTLTPLEQNRKELLLANTNLLNWWQQLKSGTGDLTGQVLGIAISAKGLDKIFKLGALGKATQEAVTTEKLATAVGEYESASVAIANNISNTPSFLQNVVKYAKGNQTLYASSYANAYDGYKKESLNLMPGVENEGKRLLYANMMSGFEAVSETIFNDRKVLGALGNEIKPVVREIVQNISKGTLDKAAALTKLQSVLLGGEYKKFIGNFLKASNQEASEEAIVDVVGDLSKAIILEQDYNFMDSAGGAFKTYYTTLLNGSLVSGMAAKVDTRNNTFNKSSLYNMAASPVDYKDEVNRLLLGGEINQQQANGKIAIINRAEQAYSAMVNDGVVDKTGKNDAKNASYLLHVVNESVNKLKEEQSKDEIAKEDFKKEAERSRKIREAIYTGLVNVDEFLNPVTEDEKVSADLDIEQVTPTTAEQTGAAPDMEQAAIIIKTLQGNDQVPEFELATMLTNPIIALQGIADQALGFGRDSEGTRTPLTEAQNKPQLEATEAKFGKEVVDKAIAMFPIESISSQSNIKNESESNQVNSVQGEREKVELNDPSQSGNLQSQNAEERQPQGEEVINSAAPENAGAAPIPKDFKKKAVQIQSMQDVNRRFDNGERIFGVHEQDEQPTELTSSTQFENYAYDQLYAYPAPEVKATVTPTDVVGSEVITDKGKMEGIVTDKIDVNDEKVSLPEKGFLISDVALNDGEQKGKGSGQEIYKKALDEHGVLYSTFPISEDALRVQDKLVEKGIAKIENIELSDGTQIRKITKSENKPILNEAKAETKIPDTKKETGTTNTEPNKVEQKTGKYEEKARKIADKIKEAELPSWLKIDDANAKKSGVGAEEIKKALANATIKMGQLLDKGVEFADAVKEAVKELVDLLGEDKREAIEKGFSEEYEGSLNNLSGIRKALVSDEIIKGVDLERIGDKEMMALGRKILDTGEVKPEVLVTKIITEGKGVLTPTEVVGLITYKRDIDTALQDTYKQINDRRAAGEDIGTLGVEAVNLERQISDFDVMAVITAQQQSMAFRLRQRMLDRDYNVVTQIERYKKNNNGEIPADVEAKFRDLDRQLKEVKAKLAESEKKAADKEAQDAVNDIKESVDREKVYTDEELDKKIQAGVESEIAKLYEELPADKKSAADKAISALEKFRAKIKTKTYDATLGIPAAIVDLGAATAIRAIKVGKTVSEAIRIGIKRIKDALKEKGIDTWYGEDAFTKDMTEFLEAEGVSTKKKPKDKPTINEDGTVSIPNEMLRDLVRRGVTDINELTDAVHEHVVKTLPDITTRQVRDYITDYGKTVNPTADEIQTQVNTAKRVGKLLSELEDLQKMTAIEFLAKYQKPKPSASKITERERELKSQIKTLGKDIVGDIDKPADTKELKTNSQRLEDAKNKVQESIEKIRNEIITKERELTEKKKPLNEDLELERLRESEASLKNLRDKYLPKEKDAFEDEKQRERIKDGLVDDIIDLNEQINAGEKKSKDSTPKFSDDAELNKLREIKKAKQQVLDIIDPKAKEEIRIKQAINAAEKSLAEYERRLAEQDTSPKEKTDKPTTPELDAIRAKRDAAKKEYEAFKKEEKAANKFYSEKQRTSAEILADNKSRVKSRIAELERKIKNKDFAKPTKKIAPTDTELVTLNTQKEKLQEQFDDAQYKLELKNRTFWQKAEDVALELTSGLVRGLVASIDLSAGFVQGFYRIFSDIGQAGYQLLTGKKVTPVRSWNAFGQMFKHLISEKASEDFLSKLKSTPAYNLMQASKLAIDDKSGKISAKEGLFISNWINLLWDKIISPVLGVGTKQGTEFIRKINPYAASQRAFDGYVNSIRVQSFIQMAKELEKDGYTFESDPKVFQKAADFVNTTTGRGSLGAADASSKWLNIIMFAPRKVISEMKLFTPYAFVYYARMPKAVRKKALLNFAQFAITYFGVNALLHAMASGGDDDEDDNFWNMNSSDFLTHKIGDQRVNIGGGMKSALVFMSRLWSGKFTDQYGRTTKLGERYGKQVNTRLDLIWRFALGKASPALGVASKKLDERKGLEVDDADLVKDLTVPIWMQDVKELYKEQPATMGAFLTVLSVFGANVRTVDESKKKEDTFKIYSPTEKGADGIRNATPEEYKKVIEETEKLTEEKINSIGERGTVWLNRYGEITIDPDEKTKDVKEYNDLTEDELKDLKSRLKEQARREVKKKITF